ncbi:hypothetical protein Esti_000251 [Eimeria stiedai]
MSLEVTGAFSNINAVQRLNAEELRLGITGEASWHHQYRDSCYIYISGLDPRLTEGDVAIVFSQWGEPIDVVLVRDQKTGVPRGFGFLGYEDQRSTILAVDNANGMRLLQRTLRVDHCKDFRPPTSGKDGDKETPYQPTGAEGGGIGKHLITKREKQLHQSRMQQQKLQQQRHQQDMARAAAGGKDVDEMWAEEFEMMLSNLNDEADAEMNALIKLDKKLEKNLKKEKKRLKKEKRRRAGSNSNRSSRSRSSSNNSRSRSRRWHGARDRRREEEESNRQAELTRSVEAEDTSSPPRSSREGRSSSTREPQRVKEERRSSRSQGEAYRERDSRSKSSRKKRNGRCDRERDAPDTHRSSRRSRSRERSGRASRRSRS